MLSENQARALLREAGSTFPVGPDPQLVERARRARRTRRLTALAAAAAVATVITGGTSLGLGTPPTPPGPVAPDVSAPAVPSDPPTTTKPEARGVTVPALEGLTQDEARTRLKELGLRPDVLVGDSCEPTGGVVGQSPKPGTDLPPGSYVDVVVAGAAAPSTCD